MQKIKLESISFKNDELKHVAELALNNKIQVFTSDNLETRITYLFLDNGKTVGYTQAGRCNGVTFSTQHKTKRGFSHGTGCGIQEHLDYVYHPTLEHINESFNHAPKWFKEVDEIEKHKSMQDYLDSGHGILTYVEVIL